MIWLCVLVFGLSRRCCCPLPSVLHGPTRGSFVRSGARFRRVTRAAVVGLHVQVFCAAGSLFGACDTGKAGTAAQA